MLDFWVAYFQLPILVILLASGQTEVTFQDYISINVEALIKLEFEMETQGNPSSCNKTSAIWVFKSVHHHTFKLINQPDATISQVYYLSFMYSSTCFGRLHAHHQELNNCNSSLWFYRWSVVIAVLLVVVRPAGMCALGGVRHSNQLQLFHDSGRWQ
jgi:hypothetical protein